MTQEELLEQIYKKDDNAFTLLYDMYAKSLFGIIINLTKDKEKADEVFQDVFIKIWKNLETYNESKGRFFTWILTIARNTAIDSLHPNDANNTQRKQSSDNFVHTLDDPNRMTNKTDAIGILEFIKKLKPKCIQLIDLLFFKDFTQQEVADELEIPLGMVKTQNRNCINELRNVLKV